MAILNFGSLNVDHVYQVDHFVRPGETLTSRQYRALAGGNGANQSIALACAGGRVIHAGKVGRDGEWLKDNLSRYGVDTSLIKVEDGPTGHAVIQVDPTGENAIVLHGGANRQITPQDVAHVMGHFRSGDSLLAQNEISCVPDILERATAMGMRIFFNPAPMTPEVLTYPLEHVHTLIVNEIEGADLTGEVSEEAILNALCRRFPHAEIVLTLGEHGVRYAYGTTRMHIPACQVPVVDTTAAGDTFIGYYVAAKTAGSEPEAALTLATRAAALCVTRPGAADSIPKRAEVEAFTGTAG